MGKKGSFKEFLRQQEASAAYKRAVATASDNLRIFGHTSHKSRPHSAMGLCSFRSSADGSIILDTSNARSSRPVSPLASRPFVRSKSTQGQREDTNRTLPFYSSDFEERYYRSYDKFVFFKSPKAGLIPKTKWELRNQAGTVMNPLYDANHPLYDRKENEQERERLVGVRKRLLTWQEIEEFVGRQMEYSAMKEAHLAEMAEDDVRKYKGLDPEQSNRLSERRVAECLSRLGPDESERHKKEMLATLEEKFFKSVGFRLGGQPKKFNNKDFISFLERQQSVMRTRAILADRHIGDYAPVAKLAPEPASRDEDAKSDS